MYCLYLVHKVNQYQWWSGVVVAHWSQSKKLTYVRPGEYLDGWPCLG